MSNLRRFVNVSAGHSKFWEIDWLLSDRNCIDVVVRWGRIGTTGQRQIKSFGFPEAARAARAFRDQKIEEKLGKGYQEVQRLPAADVTMGGDVEERYLIPTRQQHRADPVARALTEHLRREALGGWPLPSPEIHQPRAQQQRAQQQKKKEDEPVRLITFEED